MAKPENTGKFDQLHIKLTFRQLDFLCCELVIASNLLKMSDFKCFLSIIAAIAMKQLVTH